MDALVPPVPPQASFAEASLTLDHPAIREEIGLIRRLKRNNLRTNVDSAIEIGAALFRTKRELKRGLWSRLVRDELHFGVMTAARYVSIYRLAEADITFVRNFKHLGPSRLSALAGLTPDIRAKATAQVNHKIRGERTKTIEEMNQAEFMAFVRGLDPNRKEQAPRIRHLVKKAVRLANDLYSALSALKGKALDDDLLVDEFDQSMLRVKRLLGG